MGFWGVRLNLVVQGALRQLRCSGMAAGLEPRLLEAQTAKLAPIDFLSTLVAAVVGVASSTEMPPTSQPCSGRSAVAQLNGGRPRRR